MSDKNENVIVFRDLESLCDEKLPVGFSPDDNLSDRYMIRRIPGSKKILALNPTSHWSHDQGNYKKYYFVFESDEELYEWLLEPYKS